LRFDVGGNAAPAKLELESKEWLARILLLLLALIGCGSTESDPTDWYGTQQVDLQRYRRIVVAPISTSVKSSDRNRAEYLGSLYRRALLREIEKGKRIDVAQAIGSRASETLVLRLEITSYEHTRERMQWTNLATEAQLPGYYDAESITSRWSVVDARTGDVIAKPWGWESSGTGGGRPHPVNLTRRNWGWYAECFAESLCMQIGIGPVPVRVKRTMYQVEVVAIKRANVARVATHLKLEGEVEPDAVRTIHSTWGVPGNLDRIPAWEELTPEQRASLDAEVRVREWLASEVARGVSIPALARTLRRDSGVSVYVLSRELPEGRWQLEGNIGPCRIDYTLTREIQRGMDAGGSAAGGLRIGGRAELIGAVEVRRVDE
jgi:hypothetical protein